MKATLQWITPALGLMVVLTLARPTGWSGAPGLIPGLPPGVPARLPPPPPDSPPVLPPEITPVDRFRALLELDPAEREAALALRKPAQREYLQARLGEFDQLNPQERELHLQALTLRHYLLPLLRADPTNRVAVLQALPLTYRDLVRGRLAAWDRLSSEQQRTMLESESIFAGLAYVPTPEGVAPGVRALDQLPVERRRQLEADLARWRAMVPQERTRITSQFKEFLTLTESEQRKALAGLKDVSREKAARLVQRLGQLTPEQRVRSIEAFGRFSALPRAEQERFLRNAARWRAMSTEERSAWRRLVAQGPPNPPGLPGPTSAPLTPPPIPTGLPAPPEAFEPR